MFEAQMYGGVQSTHVWGYAEALDRFLAQTQ